MTRATHLKRIAYGRRIRGARVAAGLRTDGKPRVPQKPCGCLYGSCLKCAKPHNKLIIPAELIRAMYQDYQSGMNYYQLGEKYNRCRKTIYGLFKCRGLKLRPPTQKPPLLGYGVRIPEPSLKQLASLAARQPKLHIPAEIKIHWRRWSLEKRGYFIKLLRRKFPSNRPTGIFSSNVIPFTYASPEVHAIAKRMNAGRNSRTKVIALKPCSEGVIWKGMIFFWDRFDSYVRGLGWRPGVGRPLLKHMIWEEKNGPVPAGMTLIQKDGNKNNFNLSNLKLRSMADCMRVNTLHNLPPDRYKIVREKIIITRAKNRAANSRSQVAALLNGNKLINTIANRSLP